jgi:hypothetical protein
MRVAYRNVRENRSLAGVTAAATALGVVVAAAAPLWTPSLVGVIAWVVVCGAVVGIRCLQRGSVVDEFGAARHTVIETTFVPWSDVRRIEARTPDECRLEIAGREQPMELTGVAASHEPPLSDACRELLALHATRPRYARAYPFRPSLQVLVGAGALAVLVGLLLWSATEHEAQRQAARRAWDRPGTAVVRDARIDEGTDGDGDTTYSTVVRARLRLADDRVVELRMERSGKHAGEYHEEDPLPVVYDAAHPRDADFVGHPNRRTDAEETDAHRALALLAVFGGLVACLIAASLARVDWRGRVLESGHTPWRRAVPRA